MSKTLKPNIKFALNFVFSIFFCSFAKYFAEVQTGKTLDPNKRLLL